MRWYYDDDDRLGDTYDDHFCRRCGRPFVSSWDAECECDEDGDG